MEFLRIEEDGSLLVERNDPTKDVETLQQIADGTLLVVRYRGNTFQQLEVEGDGEELEDFDTAWSTIQETK